MNARQVRVVKVGGSLFELPDLACRLRQWLSRQSSAHHVLLAGGGPLADQVRQWHALRPLEEAAAHWMCVDLLTVSAHLLHARLPEIPLVEDDRLLIRIDDTGSGIDTAVMEKVFEPLFTTKGFGVGLGLSVVDQIIRQLGGGISL
ncbi:MAG: hypothetical protein IH831_10395, partial [Planctomycetes bacterium]|nr:hypothetical protein [Planctomycetota bacterium]